MNPRKYSVTRLIAVANTATAYMPDPSAMPTPATTQMVAAVVRPKTNPCAWSTEPAPRNPIPVMICAPMRVSPKAFEMLINSVEPTQIKMFVRSPAGLSRIWRSIPMIPPRMAATMSFIGMDVSMSIDDHGGSRKNERCKQPAFRAVLSAKDSVAAGHPCRPERSDVDSGQSKTEDKSQTDIPADVNGVRGPE